MLKLVLLLALYAVAGYWLWQGLWWIGTHYPGLFGVALFVGIWVVAANWGDLKLAEW